MKIENMIVDVIEKEIEVIMVCGVLLKTVMRTRPAYLNLFFIK